MVMYADYADIRQLQKKIRTEASLPTYVFFAVVVAIIHSSTIQCTILRVTVEFIRFERRH